MIARMTMIQSAMRASFTYNTKHSFSRMYGITALLHERIAAPPKLYRIYERISLNYRNPYLSCTTYISSYIAKIFIHNLL